MSEYTDEQLRMLAAQATPGPWEADGRVVEQKYWNKGFPEDPVSCEVECLAYCYGGTGRGVGRPEDAAFIAAARSAVPELLDRVADLEATLQRVREAMKGDCS